MKISTIVKSLDKGKKGVVSPSKQGRTIPFEYCENARFKNYKKTKRKTEVR